MILNTITKEQFEEVEITESNLQNLVIENFQILFPNLRLIESEFVIKGDVRLFGMSGRIDVLAYNPHENNLVIIELKKEHSKNIIIQAIDYSDYIEENLELIISRIDQLSIKEKKTLLQLNNSPKIILIAKSFFHPTIRRAKRLSNDVELYKYKYYSGGQLLIREIVDNSQIRERLQRESSSEEALLHSEKVIELTKKFLGLGLINERYHKIENDKLIINQTNLYKVYSEYFKQKELDFLSKVDFYDAIRKSKEFVKNIKGTRFKNNNTSAIMIKI
ncbi:MAG: hypothetical protein QM499_00230 [Flavobacteriaceae bacterium]